MENYAGFWIRVGAYLIDTIIIVVVSVLVGMVVGVGALGAGSDISDPSAGASLMLNLVSIVLGIAYFAGMESSSWQATLGKKALGLIVTDANGHQISFLRAVGRYFAKILSSLILLIGFIMVAFTERKQGLHDILAGTLVLKAEPGMAGTNPDVFS